MKKVGILVLVLSLALGSFAQKDTSKIVIGGKKITIITDEGDDINIYADSKEIKKKKKYSRRMDGHYHGFEIGFGNFLNSDNQLSMPEGGEFMELEMGRSLTFNINVLEKSFGIVGDYVGFVTGLGFEFNRYNFKDDITLAYDENNHIIGIPETIDFKRNRLSTTHLNVPLMLEFQIPVTGEHKRIYLSAGVTGGLRLYSRTFQKYYIDGNKFKQKNSDHFNMPDFRYGLTARVGYGDFAFFANYSLVPLFEEEMGPELYPVTFGISFSH